MELEELLRKGVPVSEGEELDAPRKAVQIAEVTTMIAGGGKKTRMCVYVSGVHNGSLRYGGMVTEGGNLQHYARSKIRIKEIIGYEMAKEFS
ncbi:hypothetical protein COU61_01325 [Candidatus Pacearchaeota archaeon CG10_big_fil_rev_8_21_14_0_10_35_13]|nr:MAG: hypothetical protein COU61_01325 [Candidatus Pacearchaeota archaeon CG10_big_fil_rev_8_21_14_0_10_35_13]